MLISFSATNFKSLKEETLFSMIAKKTIKEFPHNITELSGSHKILKSALVYGANASGKSNFFFAIAFIQILISSKPDKQKVSTFYNPFRLDQTSENDSTHLKYVFLASNNIEYRYEIEFNENEIIKELLVHKPAGRDALLFERVGSNINFGEAFAKSKEVLRDYVARNENKERLLLIIAGQLGLERIVDAYNFFSQSWFWDQTNFNLNNEKDKEYFLSILYSNKSTIWFEFFKKLIMSLDIGMKKIEVEQYKNEMTDKVLHYLTTFRNKNNQAPNPELVPFSIYDESVGTHLLLYLAIPIIDALIFGKLIVVDEIDRSLHPHIVEYLIRLFHDPEVNSKNAQLICTTHNALLMNPEYMRRDQIWIAEKAAEGASILFPISDFKELKANMPYGKYYLAGKLGGTPVINDLDFKFNFANG